MSFWYLALAVCVIVAVAGAAYGAFCMGYNLGWAERQRAMTLPESVRSKMNSEARWES